MVTGTRIAGGEGGRWLNEGVRRIVNYGWLASIEVGELAGTDKSLEAQRVSEKLEWYLSKNRVSLPFWRMCLPTDQIQISVPFFAWLQLDPTLAPPNHKPEIWELWASGPGWSQQQEKPKR